MPRMLVLNTEVEYNKDYKLRTATKKSRQEFMQALEEGEPFQVKVENRLYPIPAGNSENKENQIEEMTGKEGFVLKYAFGGLCCIEQCVFSNKEIVLDDLVDKKVYLSALRQALKENVDVVIIGGMGTGKTTLLKAIVKELKKIDEYDITVSEELPEIQEKQDEVPKVVAKKAFVLGNIDTDERKQTFFNDDSDIKMTTSYCKSKSVFKKMLQTNGIRLNKDICMIQMSRDNGKKGIYSIGILEAE